MLKMIISVSGGRIANSLVGGNIDRCHIQPYRLPTNRIGTWLYDGAD
jgi:hypothetical protein